MVRRRPRWLSCTAASPTARPHDRSTMARDGDGSSRHHHPVDAASAEGSAVACAGGRDPPPIPPRSAHRGSRPTDDAKAADRADGRSLPAIGCPIPRSHAADTGGVARRIGSGRRRQRGDHRNGGCPIPAGGCRIRQRIGSGTPVRPATRQLGCIWLGPTASDRWPLAARLRVAGDQNGGRDLGLGIQEVVDKINARSIAPSW